MNQFAHRSVRGFKRATALMIALIMFMGLLFVGGPQPAKAAGSYLMSLNRPVYASTTVDAGNTPNRAVDGDATTMWGSVWKSDPQWIYIDLGAVSTIDKVTVKWENAYATAFQVQVSSDEGTWNSIYTTTQGTGGTTTVDRASNPVQGRYVRVYCTQRVAPDYGYGIYELEVYGTGGANQPPRPVTPNIALNKNVTASSQETGDWLNPWDTLPRNIVDGIDPQNYVKLGQANATRWSSAHSDPQWISIDLGSTRTIGRVVFKWEGAYGRSYDIQVSNNGTSWTTVYRQLHGSGGIEEIPLYTSGRYIRMYGNARGSGYGYSLWEFEVYEYVAGDPQPTYTIPALPTPSTVAVGKGSYSKDDITLMQPRNPKYKTSAINTPIPSNDWWTGLLVNRLGNGIVPLPLKMKYTDKGLSILNPGSGAPNGDGGALNAGGDPDLYLMANNIVNIPTMDTKVSAFSDWTVTAVLSDDSTEKMKSTFVKGSPYVFTEFSNGNSPEIYSPVITRFFDDNNNSILTTDGASITADHIGIQVANLDDAKRPVTRYYGVFAPQGTIFKRVGNKVKMQLGSGQGYLSIATLPASSNLNYMYQHAYAFVTGSQVNYAFTEANATVSTTYTVTTQLKRAGFSSDTVMGLFPTQWKNSTASVTPISYPTIRGTMKMHEGNSFSMTQKFYGIIPQFAEPNDPTYSRTAINTYLDTLNAEIDKGYWVPDPYWQGKKLHPLATGIMIADQIGNTALRDKFTSVLKEILTNWFTYSGKGEFPYYLYYSPSWGTLNGDGGDFGMAVNLSDHHFLWGYYTYAAAVLGMYDSQFVADYGGIVEHMLRDTVNPSRTDSMYPFMRNFDPYEGHSWAGGYGDNDSGNNQESASEALFAWAGEFLWGVATNNNTYRDAGIWGFTQEKNAIEQYWFNYDKDNWAAGYNHGVAGIVYGTAYLYGTYFSGDPVCIYGIHMLPTAPYLTSYGLKNDKIQGLYNSFVADKGSQETGWFHIFWPIQSLFDPQAALAKWDPNKIANDGGSNNSIETANTYWFVHSMASQGRPTTDLYASNWTSYNVFKDTATGRYKATIWNPTASAKSVTFCNSAGTVVGTVSVPAKSLITVDPTLNPTKVVPGKIEAESYDSMSGVAKEPCGDVGGGENVGYIDTGDWMDYNVNVQTAGTYTAEYRVNGFNTGAQIQLKSGSSVLATTNVSTNNAWSSVTSATFNLSAGPQTLRVHASGGGFNLNWLNLTQGTATKVATPVITPGTGTYTGAQSVTISTGTSGATIRYTTDGSTPTATTGTVYGGAFTVSATATVKAIAYKSGMTNSDVATSVITIGTSSANLALNKTVTASSTQSGLPVENAVDGNPGTRWSSDWSDPQSITVDLGSAMTVSRVKLSWEDAYGKAYTVQLSTDGNNWFDASTVTNGDGGTDDITFAARSAKYVRLNLTQRGTGYGYSLWEFEVYQ